ncbi:helix-loop-helix domain-containing protein [Endozoicomonas numazuensis]|uniref:BHLH domain-containing protein n=1 Tax=Endozoicomonas numazuensis TaxID=1137799 RepID=A0A081NIE0_9GAMM|nr:helix-loop-helix domain-containing protein [Endozoicomonas numazuensis]KEQ18213.1 hypothetical protein GZ78_11800 [Endozoicomonas numazuensis]
MDLQAIAKPTGPVSSEAFDEREVYPCVRKSFGFYFLNTLPVKVFRLLESDREHFLGKPLCDRLKRDTNDWDIYQISNIRPSLNDRNPSDLAHSMALAYRRTTESSKDMPATPDDPTSLGYNWQYHNTTSIKLPKADHFDEGTLISVFNSEEKRTLTIKNHEDTTHLGLHAWKGLIFERTTGQNGNPVWRKGAEFDSIKKQYIQSNPLVFDIPRVFDTDGRPLPQLPTEGELYPTTKVIQDLFELKHGTRPEAFRTSEQMIPWLKNLKEDGAISFIVQHPYAAHMIAARIIRRDGYLVCYLHETLDGRNKHSEEIYEEVKTALKTAFPKMNRAIMTPAFESQKDFSSCGVFTKKTLCALAKPENKLDEWFLRQAQVPETPNGDKPKSKTRDLIIDLVEYPAVLLKLYQGSKEDLNQTVPVNAISPHAGHKLMDAVVHREKVKDGVKISSQMTLKEYREYHSYKSVLNDTNCGAQQLEYCLVSTGKRYKMLMLWRDHFLSDSDTTASTTDTSSTSELLTLRKRSHDSASEAHVNSYSESDLSEDALRIKQEHSYSLSPDHTLPAAKKKSPSLPRKEESEPVDGPFLCIKATDQRESEANDGSSETLDRTVAPHKTNHKTKHNIHERLATANMSKSYKELLTQLPLRYKKGSSKTEILRAAAEFIQDKQNRPLSDLQLQPHIAPSQTTDPIELTFSAEAENTSKLTKKNAHNQIERNRRAVINQWLDILATLIPDPEKKKRSKQAILLATIAKVKELRQVSTEPLSDDDEQPDKHTTSRVCSPELMEIQPQCSSYASRKHS